ncbi:transcription termination factor Rho [Enterocloster sp.]|jgi:transcription termination factor Rho|uniref:transcription termination factor Rho n=1 Tax=Enterocloster sp. TaxID=2719315 RepID=UPI003078980B
MREKLQTLPLAELKELAKSQGLKGISTLRKAEIIELLCRENEAAAQSEAVLQPDSGSSEGREAQSSREPQSSKENGEPRDSEKSRDSGKPRDGRPQRDSSRQTRFVRQPRTSYGQQNSREASRDSAESREPKESRESRDNRESRESRESRETGDIRDTRETRADVRESRPEPRSDTSGIAGQDMAELDSGIEANGILEVMPDGFGFIRCENFLPGENDVYVAPSQIRRFNLKTGDIIVGNRRIKAVTEKFAALLYIKTVNGYPLSATERRPNFEDLTPIFPNERLHMETRGERNSVAMRVLDLLSPIGKGQRGMIVSPPKAGKTTLLKQVARAITVNHPDMHLMILLIDERPEEVTDIREAIVGPNVEVIYSTFDEQPDRHKRVSEMVIERAKRLVEHGRDVIILLDSITRLARAYNLTVAPSGRTLSGGLDPAALYMPKRFFGAARNMREGGSLTILATALVDTGSRMDDVVYEEFKGTGNMELVLDRRLSEKRIFPAIDILKSGTRRDDLLLNRQEAEAVDIVRKATNSLKPDEAVERILDLFSKTRNNYEFCEMVKKIRLL